MKKSFGVLVFLGCAPLIFTSIAFAHIQIEPSTAVAGSFGKYSFRVLHGCDGSPTTKLTIQIPDGVISVKPQVHPGWEIALKSKKMGKPAMLHGKEITDTVSEVVFSGGNLPDEFMDEFAIDVKVPDTVGMKLSFPVIQECKKGSNRWVDLTDEAKSPAPVLTLGAAKAMSGHGHHH